jgi:hypothetical protein
MFSHPALWFAGVTLSIAGPAPGERECEGTSGDPDEAPGSWPAGKAVAMRSRRGDPKPGKLEASRSATTSAEPAVVSAGFRRCRRPARMLAGPSDAIRQGGGFDVD